MARLILLALVVVLVVWLARRFRGGPGLGRDEPPRFESTVRCERCGAYVARRHAIVDDDGTRCRHHDTHADR